MNNNDELTIEEVQNLSNYFASIDAQIEREKADEGVGILDSYCWNSDHQGGWSCRECWTEVQATGEQNNA